MKVLSVYLIFFTATLLVSFVFSSAENIEGLYDDIPDKPKPQKSPMDDTVSADLLKEKYGIDMGPGFKATSFSKDAAADLAAMP